MSRIGKHPIAVPAGVEVKVDGSTVTVKGPKGTLTKEFKPSMSIVVDGVKVLGNGEVTKSFTVKAAKFSESAKAKIESAGGKAEVE